MGRPLYGDVFGLDHQENPNKVHVEEEVDKSLWGELESEEEESDDEDEDDVSGCGNGCGCVQFYSRECHAGPI